MNDSFYNQSQPLRIESSEHASFITTRCAHSRLWFLHAHKVEERALDFLAKYAEIYRVEVYGFVMQGNHYHLLARFPQGNRALFQQHFNARLAEGVRLFVKEYETGGGSVFERRYSAQAVVRDEDIIRQFYYCALQPVASGLVSHPRYYPQYNSFFDAASGRQRVRKIVNWSKYRAAKAYNAQVTPEEFTEEYTLTYTRLPGYEQLSQSDYRNTLWRELNERLVELQGKVQSFLGRDAIMKTPCGSKPKQSKQGNPQPLCVSDCPETIRAYRAWYNAIYEEYKKACWRYLYEHDLTVEFPPGTYPPPRRGCAPPV